MVDLYSFLGTSGGAFIIGTLAGFTAKKLINVFAFVVGMQLVFFTYLEYINLVNINWEFIDRFVDYIYEMITTLRFPETVESAELYNTSGAFAGFLIGLLFGYFYA